MIETEPGVSATESSSPCPGQLMMRLIKSLAFS